MAVAQGLIVDKEIAALLRETDDGRRAQVVSTVDTILKKLEQDGLAYRMRIPAGLVGVHPANRNGYGLSSVEVHALGADIVTLGWSWSACSHAVCLEDEDSVIGKFTEQLSLQPGLAPLSASIIKYGSLSCSHTNAFLNACNAGLETEVESLQSADRRLSASTLGDADPLLKDALARGGGVAGHSVIGGRRVSDLAGARAARQERIR